MEEKDEVQFNIHRTDLLLENYSYQYHSQHQFEQLREDLARENRQLEESYEENIQSLTKKKREVIDAQEEVYQERIRLAQELESQEKKHEH